MSANSEKYYYGQDAELQKKMAERWDPELATKVLGWMSGLINRELPKDFHEALKDGMCLFYFNSNSYHKYIYMYIINLYRYCAM